MFPKDLVDKLHQSCDKHFVYNKKDQLDYLEITNCIIDCHGLALSDSKEYPYEEDHWNIFCTTIKKHVLEYAKNLKLNSSIIIPHSCWSERICEWQDPLQYKLLPLFLPYTSDEPWEYVNDDEMYDFWGLQKPMFRVVYYLKNPNSDYGTHVSIPNGVHINSGVENSIFIFDGGRLPSMNTIPSPDDLKKSPKYTIIFDWYINHPYDDPAWVLP